MHFTLAYRLYEWKREAGAKRRLADEYDAAQERGEVASHSKPSKAEGLATSDEIGITHKVINEVRIIRDAEEASPGIVRRTVIAAEIADKLEDLAELGGVGLTPHAIAVERALAVVAAVNDTIDKMASTGDFKAWNRAFKEVQGRYRLAELRISGAEER